MNASRLSEAQIWDVQRAYFERTGIDAWRRGKVPHYVTSNPFIARAYADVVATFLREASAPEPGRRAYVVELGAGSGRFSFHFVKQLFEALDAPGLAPVEVTHVMTDVARSNLEFWRGHPALAPFVAAGRLDFARFDAETDGELSLVESGETLSPERPAGPLVALANYVFDGVRQDLFQCGGGALLEAAAREIPADPARSGDDPFAGLALDYELSPARADYYEDPSWNAVLAGYRGGDGAGMVLFPTAAIGCINRLRRLSCGALLVLSADRSCPPDGILPKRPALAAHGSFSLPVNYNAIGRWVTDRGGVALGRHASSTLHVAGLLLGDHPSCFAATRRRFAEAIERFGPEDFFAVKRSLDLLARHAGPEAMLAYLRLGAWDVKILRIFLPRLVEQAPRCSLELKEAWLDALDSVWDLYFHIGEERDLAFDLGVASSALGAYRRALVFFDRSASLHGGDANTSFNEALCHLRLGERAEALAAVDRALAAQGDFEDAIELRRRLEAGGQSK